MEPSKVEEGYKYIHVNRNVIDSNRKRGTNKPPVAVRVHSNSKTKTPKKIHYGHRMKIGDHVEVVYDPENPLSCGARLWIETDLPIRIYNEETETRSS